MATPAVPSLRAPSSLVPPPTRGGVAVGLLAVVGIFSAWHTIRPACEALRAARRIEKQRASEELPVQ